MKKLIQSVVKGFFETDTGRDALVKYSDMTRTPGWQVYQAFLIEFGNRISNEVLTGQFQKLDANDKLVRLEAYSMVSETIKFLLSPMAQFNQAAKIIRHNKEMEATVKKQPKGVKKQ